MPPENPQFQNHRFRRKLDEEITEGILKTIDKAKAVGKRIARLGSDIEGLREHL